MIDIDASEVYTFADDAAMAPAIFEEEAGFATSALLAEGAGLAQDNAPVDNGDLKGKIAILEEEPFEGKYGIDDLDYAWMREEGGIIRARNVRFLRFEIEGITYFRKEVRQKGTKYMERSADTLEPQVEPAYAAAVDRTIARLGG